MNYIQAQCRTLLGKVVITRDGRCQICETAYRLESHHIVFRSEGDWKVLYDPDFSVTLCGDDHKENPTAPHVNRQLFFDMIIPRLPGDRQQKILSYINSPRKPQVEKPIWKTIRAELKSQLKELEETVWMEP